MIRTEFAGSSSYLGASFAAAPVVDIKRFIGDFEYSALTENLHPIDRMVSSRVKGSPTIQSQEGTKQCTGVLEPGDEPRECCSSPSTSSCHFGRHWIQMKWLHISFWDGPMLTWIPKVLFGVEQTALSTMTLRYLQATGVLHGRPGVSPTLGPGYEHLISSSGKSIKLVPTLGGRENSPICFTSAS